MHRPAADHRLPNDVFPATVHFKLFKIGVTAAKGYLLTSEGDYAERATSWGIFYNLHIFC